MCIVCGPGGGRLLRSIAGRYGAASRSRFVAEEIPTVPAASLDPADREELNGPADVILRGGSILTSRGRNESVEAIAVRAGRIQAVGDRESVLELRGRLTRVIELDGRALLPGFVVADWHPPMSLLCDWLEANTASEATLAAAIAEPSNEWLTVRVQGFAEEFAKRMIAKAQRPTVIVGRTGEILEASPSARALAPDSALSSLSGGSAQAPVHISVLLPALLAQLSVSSEPLRGRLGKMLRAAARRGVTTLRFCGLGALAGEGDFETLRAAGGETPPLRIRASIVADAALRPTDARQPPGFGDDMFRIDTSTHWIDEEEDEAQRLAAWVVSQRSRGWRITLHAESPAGVDLALDSLLLAASSGASLGAADGIDYRAALTPKNWTRLRRLGVSAGLTLDDDDLDLGANMAATSGDFCSLSGDAVVGPPDPLATLAKAAAAAPSRRSSSDWLPSVTLGAAARCGAGAILGSLEVGKYADFVFLDSDPRAVDMPNVGGIGCRETWIAGREVRP